MTDSEFRDLVRTELQARSLPGKPSTPADMQLWLDVTYRELKHLPAREILMAVKEYCATSTCSLCQRPVPWPSPEAIRAHVSQTVLDGFSEKHPEVRCAACDGTGWRQVMRGGCSGVERCDHPVEARRGNGI